MVTISPETLARAQGHLICCTLCEHRCQVRRQEGERGPCQAGCEARVFRHRVEMGEEVELVPSHLFYLSGCDLRCCYCIAEANAFDPRIGVELTAEFLQRAVKWGRARGARTIQWVGGEPTIHIPAILRVISRCRDLLPMVWKSDFYGTLEAFELLCGVMETYVADFKYGNDGCAQRLSKVGGYVGIVTRNLAVAQQQGNLIVRHLLLPGHLHCCYRPIVDHLAEHFPQVKFSLRDGYLPRWQAHHYGPLARPLGADVVKEARQIAQTRGLNLVE